MSRNPSRGCGQKADGACYGEGPEESEGGILREWTWVLGNGIDDFIPLNIPPLVMVVCNPAATIAARELVKAQHPTFIKIAALENYDPGTVYDQMKTRTKNIGVADHVGKDNYSAYSFARETLWHGPSRKIPPQLGKELAQIIWNNGPIPMLFTHDNMPVFDDFRHLEECVDFVAACLEDTAPIDPDGMEWVPTWEMSGWSQYTTTPDDGSNHILVPILSVLGELATNWMSHKNDAPYQEARDFFKTVRVVEQPFGMSWLGKVTYTADEEGQYSDDAKEVKKAFTDKVVDFINLHLEEEVT